MSGALASHCSPTASHSDSIGRMWRGHGHIARARDAWQRPLSHTLTQTDVDSHPCPRPGGDAQRGFSPCPAVVPRPPSGLFRPSAVPLSSGALLFCQQAEHV
jgi:hypothetical protein